MTPEPVDDLSAYRRAAQSLDVRTVRTWALANGIEVSRTGGIPRFVYELYRQAHPAPPAP